MMKIHAMAMSSLMALALAGCAHDHDDHDHEAEGRDHSRAYDEHVHDEVLQLAAYSDDFEAFAEAAPFVAGQTSDILVHISFLEDFKPLTNGSVTASLIIGANHARQTIEQPLRPGVWQFSLRPASSGTGRLVFDIKAPEKTSQIVVPDITVYANEHDAHEVAAAAVLPSGVNGAVFTKEQSWKVDFATTEARVEPFGQVIRATAQIQPSQGDERVVATTAGGVVFFLDNNMMAGKAVSAKQALFSTDGSDMADNDFLLRHAEAESGYNRAKAELNRAKAGLDRAKAGIIRAKAELDRKQELAKEHIVSQSDLLNAKMDMSNAEMDMSNAETDMVNAETNLSNTEVVYNNSLRRNFATGKYIVNSPVDGFVTRVLARNGEYAEAGQPVLVISQYRDLLIKAELQPRYFDMLNHIASVNIRLMNSDRVYTLEETGGRLISYGKATDVANPLIPVLFQVNNMAGLAPGGFVEMFIKTQTSAQATTIPNEAIIEEMGNYFAYVQITPEYFEKRVIRKGATDGVRTEITGGVSAGDRVVSKGAMLIKLSQISGALDTHAGHAH